MMRDVRKRPRHFFFYGTLQGDFDNAVTRRIMPKLAYVGSGSTAGRLFAVEDPKGVYPALVPNRRSAAARAHGKCYEMLPAFGAADMTCLDAYEDYAPSSAQRSLYRRKMVDVTLEDGGHLPAWCYVYNLSISEHAQPIASGDFAAHLRSVRAAPYLD